MPFSAKYSFASAPVRTHSTSTPVAPALLIGSPMTSHTLSVTDRVADQSVQSLVQTRSRPCVLASPKVVDLMMYPWKRHRELGPSFSQTMIQESPAVMGCTE